MKLSKHTIDELENRLWVCESEPDLQEVVPLVQKVIDEGTVEALAASKAAQEELLVTMEWEEPGAALNGMVRDLCLAGYFPVYDDESIVSRKIKKRTVKGVVYSCGY